MIPARHATWGGSVRKLCVTETVSTGFYSNSTALKSRPATYEEILVVLFCFFSLSRVAETVPTGFCSNSTALRASHQQPRPGEVTMQHLDHFDVHEAASEPVQQDDATTRL